MYNELIKKNIFVTVYLIYFFLIICSYSIKLKYDEANITVQVTYPHYH